MKDNDRAILYCRVSTTRQADEGVSLEAQESELRAYCKRRGLTVDGVVVDAAVSGKTPLDRREGGAFMLGVLRRRKTPVGHVVAMKLDRLFRNLRDCLATTEGWDRDGVSLHLVDLGGQTVDTSTAIGRFFMATMGAVAELERGMTSERVKGAMAHKRAQGRRTSLCAPYGYRIGDDGDTLEPVEAEQRAVRRARELRYGAGLSYRKVAVALQSEGYPARGERWHKTSVVRLINREAKA